MTLFNRISAFLLGLIIFAETFFVYTEYIAMAGFPDGHLTELGRGERNLAYVFTAVSLIVGTYFIRLGWTAAKNKIGKRLWIVFALYSIFVICLLAVDRHFSSYLDNGLGG